MNFTFGIVTDGNSNKYLNECIKSIINLRIPKYEIIVVGGNLPTFSSVKHLSFEEKNKTLFFKKKPGWITKKKNLITQHAKYKNIVYCHDYIMFDKNWYSGFIEFSENFEICMTKIINKDGTRYRDWTLWPHNNNDLDLIIKENRECLLPYDEKRLTRYMYISGAYWVGKKDFMNDNKLNENLFRGQGEDVEWSKRIREKCEFKINKFSSVHLQKQKEVAFVETTINTQEKINQFIKNSYSLD